MDWIRRSWSACSRMRECAMTSCRLGTHGGAAGGATTLTTSQTSTGSKAVGAAPREGNAGGLWCVRGPTFREALAWMLRDGVAVAIHVDTPATLQPWRDADVHPGRAARPYAAGIPVHRRFGWRLMPFDRPTIAMRLTRNQRADIVSRLPGTDPLLRRSYIGALSPGRSAGGLP